MRIVHEVNTPMQVGAGSSPYCNIRGTQGYNGMRLDLTICTSPRGNHPELEDYVFAGEHEVIEIEGDIQYILPMLRQAVAALEGAEKFSRESLGEKRPTSCPNCEPAAQYPNATHTEDCPADWQNMKASLSTEHSP